MSVVSASLSNQCYEMAIHLISSEILASSADHSYPEMLSLLASSDSSSEEEDLLYLFLLKKVYKCCVICMTHAVIFSLRLNLLLMKNG